MSSLKELSFKNRILGHDKQAVKYACLAWLCVLVASIISKGNLVDAIIFPILLLARIIGLFNRKVLISALLLVLTMAAIPIVFFEDIMEKLNATNGHWNVTELSLPFFVSCFFPALAFCYSLFDSGKPEWRRFVMEAVFVWPGLFFSMTLWVFELGER